MKSTDESTQFEGGGGGCSGDETEVTCEWGNAGVWWTKSPRNRKLLEKYAV